MPRELVVRRLKRAPTILAKVKRGAKVETMNDIGGIRIIVKNLKMVNEISDKIENSKTNNKLLKKYDYLTQSKESGYRGIHLVYSYQGEKKNYKNYRIELQIRSKIQHSWATAVEVLGTFRKQDFKSGDGNKEWLKFFKLVSVVFKNKENEESIKEQDANNIIKKLIKSLKIFFIKNKISKHNKKFGIIEKLGAFTRSIEYLTTNKKEARNEGLFLLRLKINDDNYKIEIKYYSDKSLLKAIDDYMQMEAEIKDSKDREVVLVQANSINEIKTAYPNYFADTRGFLEILKEIIQK